MSVSARELQTRKIREGKGFIAALDQSGGSTPDVLTKYGIPKSEYEGNDAKMAELVHEFRTRIITSKALKPDKLSVPSCLKERWIARSEANQPLIISGMNAASFLS
jgi:fructose-bisphosphate aldolase class 1